MKFFVVFACALAAASAGYVHPVVYGAQHLPIVGANGVPVDTAEVQLARAAHAVHKVDALARNGDLYHGVVAHVSPVVSAYATHAAPLVSAYATHGTPLVAAHGVAAHGVAAYPTTAVLPTNINGTPLETPEVVAAKLNHFAAHADAAVRNVHGLHYRKRRGIVAAAPHAYSGVAGPVVSAYSHAPVVSTYSHAPLVGSTYAHSPLVASTYSHSPLVASTYAHTPLVASTYAANPWAYSALHHY